MPVVRGKGDGWLKVLSAPELFKLIQAGRALDAMWRQSHLSLSVWQRDLLPAVQRYAEFVQLMPASEAHHHAHVGGLLSHTVEMTLAAMTWRNGHFFPEAACVEEMDAQRDEWTYVVFFAALLHDIGKIMTDLRVSWTAFGMEEAVRWVPMSGPLTSVVQARPGGEYLVEFTPKSARDYQAHSRLSISLLQHVAPASALSFMARRPHAFDALTQYLNGADKHSQLAQLVRKADQASAIQALAHGSRERFATSTAVALIDLLMQSMREMLKAGTALPLNRSGAAGWIFEGSVWFVAKRLADAVRQHIREHRPDEAVPGENKNDRLFDTWQEYGCIIPNPQSGQAIWYVQVHGSQVAASDRLDGVEHADEEEGAYCHALTMLRFPLEKIYKDASQYPPSMRGRIEVLVKRSPSTSEPQIHEGPKQETGLPPGVGPPLAAQALESQALFVAMPESAQPLQQAATPNATEPAMALNSKPRRPRKEDTIRAPSFKRPIKTTNTPPKTDEHRPAGGPTTTQRAQSSTALTTRRQNSQTTPPASQADPTRQPSDRWLDFEDDAAVFRDMPVLPQPGVPPGEDHQDPRSERVGAMAIQAQQSAPSQGQASRSAATHGKSHGSAERVPALPTIPVARPLLAQSEPAEGLARSGCQRLQTEPVLLSPFLPELPHEVAGQQVDPSESVLDFMNWLQQGLAHRSLKYNEAGALVHFTAEGMALVSPLIFKTYFADRHGTVSNAESDAQALQVQREVIKAGWHLMGPGKTNILKYQVLGRAGVPVGKLSAVVLTRPDRWVVPVPPSNPVLRLL